MKREPIAHYVPRLANTILTALYIQAPLPFCLDTLPKLLTIEGQGSGRQGPSPLAPPEKPAND